MDGEMAGDVADGVAELEAAAAEVRGHFLTMEDMTKAFIRTAIIRGLYAPGQRLQQDVLAEVLGVSRMPVRAALRQLESEGLVTFHPHRGAEVKELSPSEIAEIYELRIALECLVLELAIPKLSDAALADLTEARHPSESTEYDPVNEAEQRNKFYGALCDVAQLPQTKRILMNLHAAVGPYKLFHRVKGSEVEHLGLLQHLRDRDIEGAKRWLRKHLTGRSQVLQEATEQHRQSAPTR